MKIKIDENNVITGYFKLINEKPYRATGCNMQQNDNGIEIEDNLLDTITVGKSKFIDNEIINEE